MDSHCVTAKRDCKRLHLCKAPCEDTHEAGCVTESLAKFLIFSRTTEIPRSSEAFSSNTLVFISSGLAGAERVFCKLDVQSKK